MADADEVGVARGLTNYGDRGFALYLRRSFVKSMGYSGDMLSKPVVGIASSPSGFNNCHRSMPELVEAVKRGVLAAGGLPIDFPTISLGEVFLNPDQSHVPQPDEHGRRGDGARAADGRGGADRRLRQDRAGAADGRGLRRPAGDPAGHRADDDRAPQGRAARRLHRLPPLLGQLPRRQDRARGNRRGRGPPGHHGRHLRGDGHRQHHGLHRRGARHVAAGQRGDSRRARRPAARRRGERRAGGADGARPGARAAAQRSDHAEVGGERAARAARARRLDQRHHPPDRDRRAAGHPGVAAAAERAQRNHAGAGQPEADRRQLHGGLLRRRRHERGAARAEAAAAPRLA